MAASTEDRPAPLGRQRLGTTTWILTGLVVGAVCTLTIVISVSEYGAAARTSYTQAHGIRRAARVISEHSSTGKAPTSMVAVRLGRPVKGHDTTTVHIKGTPTYLPGAPVTVVVDPQDPAYAELPGAPFTSSALWEFTLLIGLVGILLVPFAIGVTALRRRRSQRRLTRSFLR